MIIYLTLMDAVTQAKEILQKSKIILTFPAPDFQGDVFAASLGLTYAMQNIGKKANLLAEEFPKRIKFLKDQDKTAVIAIDTTGKGITQLRYEKDDQNLKIYLTLKGGELSESDVYLNGSSCFLTQTPKLKPDLIIVVGAKDLESLGNFFTAYQNIFAETPILNIDNQESNTKFGTVNLVDPIASSISEIVARLVFCFDLDLCIPKVATPLLCGIVCATQNFQNSKTTSTTLEIASLLMKKGADHQTIINNLFKKRSLAQVRLLGKALENLCFNEDKKFASIKLRSSDFKFAKADSKDLAFVVEELKSNFWNIPSFLLLWESHRSDPIIKGILCSKNQNLIEEILWNFEGIAQGETALFLIREPELTEAEKKVLDIL